jgi:uncharacterized protein with HEPN domain
MQRDDIIRLRHMLDAAQEAISFARGKKREDIDHERMLNPICVEGEKTKAVYGIQ